MFKLEYPYTERWNSGYLVTNGEDRKTVILYNSHSDRSSTSYARYLMSVYLERFLKDEEHVDHINDDRTDDRIENLQILTLAENNKKSARLRGRVLVEIECPVCKNIFTRRKGNTQLVKCNKNKICCCNNKCRDELAKMNMSLAERIRISEESVLREFRSYE